MAEIHDSCGVMGIWGRSPELLYMGREMLSHANHRGQEGTGMAVGNGTDLLVQKGQGLVSEVFSDRSSYWHALLKFPNPLFVMGHDRYSTHGSSTLVNVQPVEVSLEKFGARSCAPYSLAYCSNGDVVNMLEQRAFLSGQGANFVTTVDAEVIAWSIAYHFAVKGRSLVEAIGKMMEYVRGVYSSLLATENTLFAFRDPFGLRPLFMGEDPIAFASETCMLNATRSRVVREVKPGEVIEVDCNGKIRSYQVAETQGPFLCAFEWIYFSRPDSRLNGITLHKAREQAGAFLIKKHPVPDADLVTFLPETGVSAALGAHLASDIPIDRIFIKNRYSGRGFIFPEQSERRYVARRKNNPLMENIVGKTLVVYEDSIVRGTTTQELIQVLFAHGAKKIYLYLVSPPYSYPCFYGVDTGKRGELLTAQWAHLAHEVIERNVAEYLDGEGTTRLVVRYLMSEELGPAYGMDLAKSCIACFNERYPISIPSIIPSKEDAEG